MKRLFGLLLVITVLCAAGTALAASDPKDKAGKKYGIAAARLQPFGAGPAAPVESNATEEGRAKNRRVELVAQ